MSNAVSTAYLGRMVADQPRRIATGGYQAVPLKTTSSKNFMKYPQSLAFH
jgi:hypothetical protein